MEGYLLLTGLCLDKKKNAAPRGFINRFNIVDKIKLFYPLVLKRKQTIKLTRTFYSQRNSVNSVL